MRVLLVKPQTELLVARRLQEGFLHLEPLELEIIAGGVPKQDEVQILDLSLEKNPAAALKNKLADFKPEIVGLTAYSTTHHIAKKLSRTVKDHDPFTTTIVGGIHATLRPEDYAVDSIDFIVRGEGGHIIGDMINRIRDGKELNFSDGILSPSDPDFDKKAEKESPPYPAVEDIPMPRRDLVDRSKYYCVWTSSESGRLDNVFPQVATMRTSLGCPFSCSFCVIHHMMHKKYLQRKPEDVVAEIEALEEDHVYFVDDEMFVNAERVRKIAELLIERGIKRKYISWARSDTIVKHPDLFKLWKKAGLDVVYVGLESMDDKVLKEYDKKTCVDDNQKAIQILKDLDIMLHAAFIVRPDFSAEDFRSLEATIAAISPAEIAFTVLSPSPGTQMWHDLKKDFICDPFKYYDCMHSVVPTKLTLRRFYQHFGRLNSLALRANPLRMNKVKVPFKDLLRAIVMGTRYVFSLYLIYKDYPPEMWLKKGDELKELAQTSCTLSKS